MYIMKKIIKRFIEKIARWILIQKLKLYDCDYRLKREYNLEFPLEKFIFELPRYTSEFFLTKLLANFFNQFLALLK